MITWAPVIILGLLIFWPKKGFWYQWQELKQKRERIKIEDALKHFYECEQKQSPCSLNSLAGSLYLKRDKAVKLINLLEGSDLITLDGEFFKLTDEGRQYALRVIRIHRLWEHYLSEQTGVPAQNWHSYAEKKEHSLDANQADDLYRQLGHPAYDPHGDPIPTIEGEIPPQSGIFLTELKKGEFAEVLHIEDEPENIYNQIKSMNINPNSQLEVLENSPDKIKIDARDNIHTLSAMLAANITVKKIDKFTRLKGAFDTLDQLKPGEKGEVLLISQGCRGQQRRRLMDLGIVPGSIISAEMRSLPGDPTAFNIRGTLIALRRDHSSQIYIRRIKEN